MKFTWENSIILKNEMFKEHIAEKNSDYNILYLLGKGFDPRMCKGIKLLSDIGKKIEVMLIQFYESDKSTSHEYVSEMNINYEYLRNIDFKITEIDIKIWNSINERKTSVVFSEIIKKCKAEIFNVYDEIIIDISSMPRSVSFNLIKTILRRKDERQKISIVVCENSDFDDNIIITNEFETANYLNGFDVFSMGMESQSDAFVVWLPILGKNSYSALEKIHMFLKPDEICPVLPFPSKNARRSDEILLEYRELLGNQFYIEKRNIIYVPEFNPIQAYIKFCNIIEHYRNILDILGDTKFMFSVQSSKLMDLGALLSVLELQNKEFNVGFAIVENEGYQMNKDSYNSSKNDVYYIKLMENFLE